jgi:hypothetical protein
VDVWPNTFASCIYTHDVACCAVVSVEVFSNEMADGTCDSTRHYSSSRPDHHGSGHIGFGSCRVVTSKFLVRIQPVARSGRVRIFLYVIFGLGHIFFLGSDANFSPLPTHRTIGSGFFRVGSCLSGRAAMLSV